MSDLSFSNPLHQAKILGLLMECPIDCGNPKICPLHEVRKMPLADRLEWCQALNYEEFNRRMCMKCLVGK